MLVFDPRFLVFEFVKNILLRGPRVRLVRSFMASLESKKNASHCEQMIMGGKTRGAPLLALLLADGRLWCRWCRRPSWSSVGRPCASGSAPSSPSPSTVQVRPVQRR